MSTRFTIAISDRAYADIINETLQNIRTETGGVLLGIRNEHQWYVIESLDPGPKAILSSAYFEYDHDYMTHLANKVRLRYHEKLTLLGLWHRHPGGFDRFSLTDDGTNTTFARLCGGAAISGLVNIDPDFRMTFYLATAAPLAYERAPVEVGDRHIPAEYLKLRNPASLLQSLSAITRVPPLTRWPQLVASDAESPALAVQKPTLLTKLLASLRLWRPDQSDPTTRQTPTIDRVEISTVGHELAILDLIDQEITFLDQQQDYSYELSLGDGGLRVILKRALPFRECPPQIDLLFCVATSGVSVCLGTRRYPYRPGITRELIETAMTNFH